jgi:DNA-binding response OmpR family regulator
MDSILLVEDDPDVAEMLERGLAQDSSLELRHAESAEEALDEIESEPWDLLIVDWMLPKLNGPRLIEKLREGGWNVPILMLTVRDDLKDRVHGLERGADDYLTKPFEMEELRARVRALLRRPPEWKPLDRLTVGPLVLETRRQEALLSGEPMDLREKAFDLLWLLADEAPNVVPREVIAERVWEVDHVSDNSIDVTVSGIRKKIGEASEASNALRLETVRSVGYRLVTVEGRNENQ